MSNYASAMSEVVGSVAQIMNRAGFRQRRHSFNRDAEPGIVQVINLQMGQKLPPGAKEMPPMRLDLHGQFIVNLGIFIAEDFERRLRRKIPSFVNEYDCSIRQRLGQLLGYSTDVWWPLVGNPSEVGAEIGKSIEEVGLPWLDRFTTRDLILEEWSQGHLSIISPVPNLLSAVILVTSRRASEGQTAINDHYAAWLRDPKHPGHGEYVQQLALELGLDKPQ